MHAPGCAMRLGEPRPACCSRSCRSSICAPSLNAPPRAVASCLVGKSVRKLWAFAARLEADIRVPHAPVAVFKYVASILVLANFSACALYFIARLQGFGPQTYLAPLLFPDGDAKGERKDWAGLGIAILDAADSLWLMGLEEEFAEAEKFVAEELDVAGNGHSGSLFEEVWDPHWCAPHLGFFPKKIK